MNEIHCMAIEAIAQACRRWPVREDVTQMRVATAATDFGSDHAMGLVFKFPDRIRVDCLEKAGPAAAGIEFCIRHEQRRFAAHAIVTADELVVPVGTGERALGAGLAGHIELLGCKLLHPFGGGLFDLGFQLGTLNAPFV